jgi:Glycosyltransferase family 28 C-terminal domain
MTRVCFFAFNGMGLGHIQRLVRLCRRMLELDPTGELRPLFVTNSLNHQWLQKEGWPYCYVPSAMEDSFTFPVNGMDFSPEVARRFPPDGLGLALLERIIEHVRPAMVVADTYFFSGLPEYCRAHDVRFVGVFDSDWCEVLHAEPIAEILNHDGTILVASVPDCQGPVARNFFYSGPLLSRHNPAREKQLAERYWKKPGAIRIVCTQGGGGFTAANSSFEAQQGLSFPAAIDNLIGELRATTEVEALFFTGPYYRKEEHPEWVPKHVAVQGFEPDLGLLFASADLALIRGGYSQICEVISMDCPAIVYPRREATDDQRQNLAMWAGHPAILCWEGGVQDSLDTLRARTQHQHLTQLRSLLADQPKPDGLQRAAMFVLKEIQRVRQPI